MAAGLQELVDNLATALRRGVTVDDAQGRLLAYSAQGQDVDTARVQAILGRSSDPAVRAWEARFGVGRAGPHEIPANPQLGMASRRAVLLVHRGEVLGRVMVLSGSVPWTPEDEARLGRAGEQAAALLAAQAARSPQRLLGRVVDAWSEQEARAAWTPLLEAVPGVGEPGLWAVAVLGGGDSAGHEALVRRWPGVLAWASSGDLVLLTSGEGRSVPPSALTPLVGERGAGRSGPSQGGLGGLRRCVAEARVTAQLARIDPSLGRRAGDGPTSWAATGIYRNLIGRAWDTTCLDPLLGEAATGPDLLHTLEVWLDHAGDVRASAHALHLHRSSLYHRLERIAERLGVDLADGPTRLELHAALTSLRAGQVVVPPGWAHPV